MKTGIFRSFTFRIFLTVLLVALVPLVISYGLMLPMLTERSGAQQSAEARTQLAQAQLRLEDTIGAMKKAAAEIRESEAVQSALARRAGEEKAVYEALFRQAAPLYDYGHFYLYDALGHCLYAVNGGASAPAMQADWGILQRAAREEEVVMEGTVEGSLLLAGRIGDAGYVVIVMDRGHFEALFSGCCDTSSSLLLLDARWRLVYASQALAGEAAARALREQLWAGQALTGDSGEFHFYSAPVGGGFTLLLRNPMIFTRSVMNTFYLISGLMGTLCLAVCLLGGWVLSRHLARPVRELSHAMGEVERGNLTLRLPEGREDELGQLTNRFNRMVEEYQQNLSRSVQRQKELNDTRLRMMQAQLNPHFLYNSLDSIKWMGVTHEAPQLATLVADLASLLRASISGDEFVTLEKELELVERYIDIQSIRFEDRFACEIDVAEEFQGCVVPKLVLQPLVENAIIHGVGDREDGYVKIWARTEGEDLVLCVSDNGCGMPPQLVEAINRGDAREGGGHLGIYNVDSIIKLHYGPSYGITAKSAPEEGSQMSVKLPMRKKEEKEC